MKSVLRAAALVLLAIVVTGYGYAFAQELGEETAGFRSDTGVCIDCHASEMIRPGYRDIPEKWAKSWHKKNDVSCHDCHGGDPDDAAMAMAPERGFVGVPEYDKVPEFCGKCHIGIMGNYLESGHGRALKEGRGGPNCVTCHGSHDIQKASIEIINEERCSQCHSYDRAKTMKQALFVVEKLISESERDIQELNARGIYTDKLEKTLFSIHARFRTLFHTVDVSLVKQRTEEFTDKLDKLQSSIAQTFRQLAFRKNLSAFFMMLFAAMAVLLFLLSKRYG